MSVKSSHIQFSDKNLQWFVENQRRLADFYEGMYMVIHKCNVIATFRDEAEAYDWATRKNLEERFIIKPARRGTRYYLMDNHIY